jgi:hypothetical protein
MLARLNICSAERLLGQNFFSAECLVGRTLAQPNACSAERCSAERLAENSSPNENRWLPIFQITGAADVRLAECSFG